MEKTNEFDNWDSDIKIDILIPFYNQHKLLSRCLKSVELSGYRDGKIVIVNDCSDPHDLSVIEDVCADLNQEITIVSHKTNKGFKESILTGVKKCRNSYVILVNSDTVVTDNFAHKLTGVMLKDKRFRAVAPISNHPTDLYQFRKKLYLKQQFDDNDHHTIIARFEPLLKKRWLYNIKKRCFSSANVTEAFYLSANCLALDREVFERAGFLYGGYDHGYFEDLDLCCSIRDLGYKLAVNEDCFVFHRGQGSYTVKSREWKEQLVWKNYYIFKERWGHLPEHRDLEKRMYWAGRECPI